MSTPLCCQVQDARHLHFRLAHNQFYAAHAHLSVSCLKRLRVMVVCTRAFIERNRIKRHGLQSLVYFLFVWMQLKHLHCFMRHLIATIQVNLTFCTFTSGKYRVRAKATDCVDVARKRSWCSAVWSFSPFLTKYGDSCKKVHTFVTFATNIN